MSRTRLIVFLALLALTALVSSHSQERKQTPPPGLPVGAIVAWHVPGGATAKPPAGWQLCDGSPISEPRFVRRFGAGHHTPNLNGNPRPAGKRNAGQHTFLRGNARSPADGYGGSSRVRHRHGLAGHTHDVAHTHAIDHTHGIGHTHRISLRTSTAGGFGGGPRGGVGAAAGRHSHDVRGSTDHAGGLASQGPSSRSSGGASPSRSGRPQESDSSSAELAVEPRYFDVTFIMRIY